MGMRTGVGVIVCLAIIAGTSWAQEPLAPQGPVGYWKLDETSGTTAVNSAVGGLNGTYSGGPTPNASVPAPPISYPDPQSVAFSGTGGQCVTVPNFGTFTNTTVSVWINRSANTGSRESIVSYKEGNGVNMGFVLCLNENGASQYPRLWVQINGSWQAAEQASAVPTGSWIHIAGTYDGTLIRLYRDGVQVATGGSAGAMTNNTNPQNCVIGGRADSTTNLFPGLIDDVRIYSRALTANEIAVLAAGCPAPTGLTASPTTGPVSLNWTAPAGVDPGYTYNIKRGSASGYYPTLVASGVSGTTYVDNTATVGNYYYYVVTALSAAESGNSTEVIAYPPVSALPNVGLQTDENGATTQFTITYNAAAPLGGSLLAVDSSNTGEGVVSTTYDTVPPSRTATATGFTLLIPQGSAPSFTVFVTGVNDLVADGNQAYTVTVSAGGMSVSVPPVQLVNNDNDTPNITYSKTSGLVTTESGGTDFFLVALTTQPVGTVRLTLTSSNPSEGIPSPSFIDFDSTNWNIGVPVTLIGQDDPFLDFGVPYTISGTLSGPSDPPYNTATGGIVPPVVSAINLDNEPIPEPPHAWGGSGGGGGCGLLGLEVALVLLALRGRSKIQYRKS